MVICSTCIKKDKCFSNKESCNFYVPAKRTNLQELNNTRDMFDGCLNRLTVTDDLNEFAKLCSFANSYLSKIMKFNYERLQEQYQNKKIGDDFK